MEFQSTAGLIDDVLIMAKTFDEEMHHLEELFHRLRLANVKIALKKCQFFQPMVEFLGHRITSEGLKPHKKHVENMIQFKTPQTIEEIRSFLGLVRFNEGFIANMACKMEPLLKVLRGGKSMKFF